jgi:hypothetical protein
MTEWELARYFIDAKKSIDSVLYISEYGKRISNVNLREKTNEIRRKFYINCCVVLDKSFPREKKSICEDKVISSIYYERDKNGAHKDENYIEKEYESFIEMADDMKRQIESVYKICANFLPQQITLDYVAFDSELFRIANGITKSIEEQIMLDKHPERGEKLLDSVSTKTISIFNDTEDLRKIPEHKRNEYSTLFEMGMNTEESLQKLQDGCIRTNLLYGEKIWVAVTKENIEKQQHLRNVGLYDFFDRPIIPKDEVGFNKFIQIMKSEGLVNE